MRHLGFIPVRGGSKRLPRKNLMDLGGKSITHRALDTAIESGVFTDIILSTDDDEIIKHCSEYVENGKIIIDKRDPSLAQDKSTVLQVALELIARLEAQGNRYDTFTAMLATCPFKTSDHIKSGFELYTKNLDAVLSVTEYDFPWEFAMDMDNENIICPSLENSPLITKNTRTQDRKKVYHPNGALYLCSWDSLIKNKNFFVGNIKGYVMDNLHSQDIDEEKDMMIAEFMIEKGLV